jgi:hypothetical protein
MHGLSLFADPMLSLTAASYTVSENDVSTMDICAEINNVLSPSGTLVPITVDLIVTAGTASMSLQMPPVAMQALPHPLPHSCIP